jgi:hypothetical protein
VIFAAMADGCRLVIQTTDQTHTTNDGDSTAVERD